MSGRCSNTRSWEQARPTLRRIAEESGNALFAIAFGLRLSLVEFDANQVFRSPYHRAPAPQAISNDQKGKLRRDAQWAGDLQRRPSVGLVTNETGDRAPIELDAS